MARKGRNFSAEEDSVIRRLLDEDQTADDIGQALGRSTASTRARIEYLRRFA